VFPFFGEGLGGLGAKGLSHAAREFRAGAARGGPSMVILHFLAVVVILGLWILLGLLEDRLTSPYLAFWTRALRGGTLGVVLCTLVAVMLAPLAHIQAPTPAETRQSHDLVFVALALSLSMIGFPIGFLVGVLRGRRDQQENP